MVGQEEGEIFAGSGAVIALDYAEYFPAEEILMAGQLVV